MGEVGVTGQAGKENKDWRSKSNGAKVNIVDTCHKLFHASSETNCKASLELPSSKCKKEKFKISDTMYSIHKIKTICSTATELSPRILT